ncbi:hypothetical protein AAG570_007163 [Ranatra chinensis]|uniref:Uncharacterized protein n=1 Tax=Ranatra chinensis TaxID=642074 RepID=A0ABD0XV32_9HEMI
MVRITTPGESLRLDSNLLAPDWTYHAVSEGAGIPEVTPVDGEYREWEHYSNEEITRLYKGWVEEDREDTRGLGVVSGVPKVRGPLLPVPGRLPLQRCPHSGLVIVINNDESRSDGILTESVAIWFLLLSLGLGLFLLSWAGRAASSVREEALRCLRPDVILLTMAAIRRATLDTQRPRTILSSSSPPETQVGGGERRTSPGPLLPKDRRETSGWEGFGDGGAAAVAGKESQLLTDDLRLAIRPEECATAAATRRNLPSPVHASERPPRSRLDFEEFDVENERGVGRDSERLR